MRTPASGSRGLQIPSLPGAAVREPVYRAFWGFAAERQRIFYRRLNRQPAPWTADPILGRYKFCNVYRATDRVSQFLIRHVIYLDGAPALPPEDAFMRVILFRLFSKPATWTLIESDVGLVRRRTLDTKRIGQLLDRALRRQSIYTSAFILCAHDPYGYRRKHRNHLALVRDMFRPRALGTALGKARSLREVYEALIEWPMLGPFMSYQLAIDLNYTPFLDFSEDDFTEPGPGSRRGIAKVFSELGGWKPVDVIQGLVEAQESECARLGEEVPTLFGRRLHAIDVQGLFCEIDKYSRVAFPDLRSQRTRIKHQFRPSEEPLSMYFPPKWDLRPQSGPPHGMADAVVRR